MKIFISHSSYDKWVARQISHRLIEKGHTTFLDEKDIKTGDSGWKTIGEFAAALASSAAKLGDLPGLKPVLRLHPPRKGYKTIKRTFPQGGALGYYGTEINTLLYKMR